MCVQIFLGLIFKKEATIGKRNPNFIKYEIKKMLKIIKNFRENLEVILTINENTNDNNNTNIFCRCGAVNRTAEKKKMMTLCGVPIMI